MSKDKAHTIEDLINKIKKYVDDENEISLIKKAYSFAFGKHFGQIRKSGEEYIVHPLETAYILAGIYSDISTIISGLLHDVLEDCECSEDEMTKEFSLEVTNLVKGVTKLGKINYSTENEYLIEYYKKIIVGMSEDPRVIIIKLADRLHNMRTLWALSIDKQKRIAKETMEIFAPIGHHLGIHKIKGELEDLSLRYLKPDVFYDIAERLNTTKLERDHVVNEMLKSVSDLLNDHNIKHTIKGRAKSIYSIYNKLDKGKKFSDIFDLFAMRVFVDAEQECYLALGLIHSRFKPMPRRFKDYIARPKSNLYQSLHTTVFGTEGDLFEIQIRTYEMDEIAENGIASHWAYKENRKINENSKNVTEQKLQVFKNIIELNNGKLTNEEFIDTVKMEVLNNNLYVFTPKGDVIELTKGSTPIDFAYKVHTRVGETMIGAIVNNNIVSLDYELQNNDIVKINTSKTSLGPSKEWVNIAKSSQTKNKIRAFFTKNERDLYIERGKESLEKELRKRKIAFGDFFNDSNNKILFSELKLENLEEVYLSIGNGKNSPIYIINILFKEDKVEDEKIKKVKLNKTDLEADVMVAGIDKIRVNLANCCNPIPGDSIIGYITKTNGISIHTINCHNIDSVYRTVSVEWNNTNNKRYLCTIIVHTNTTVNNMLEIIQHISIFDTPTDKINNINRGNDIIYEIDIYVKNKEQLDKIFRDLNKLSYVVLAERVMK